MQGVRLPRKAPPPGRAYMVFVCGVVVVVRGGGAELKACTGLGHPSSIGICPLCPFALLPCAQGRGGAQGRQANAQETLGSPGSCGGSACGPCDNGEDGAGRSRPCQRRRTDGAGGAACADRADRDSSLLLECHEDGVPCPSEQPHARGMGDDCGAGGAGGGSFRVVGGMPLVREAADLAPGDSRRVPCGPGPGPQGMAQVRAGWAGTLAP